MGARVCLARRSFSVQVRSINVPQSASYTLTPAFRGRPLSVATASGGRKICPPFLPPAVGTHAHTTHESVMRKTRFAPSFNALKLKAYSQSVTCTQTLFPSLACLLLLADWHLNSFCPFPLLLGSFDAPFAASVLCSPDDPPPPTCRSVKKDSIAWREEEGWGQTRLTDRMKEK